MGTILWQRRTLHGCSRSPNVFLGRSSPRLHTLPRKQCSCVRRRAQTHTGHDSTNGVCSCGQLASFQHFHTALRVLVISCAKCVETDALGVAKWGDVEDNPIARPKGWAKWGKDAPEQSFSPTAWLLVGVRVSHPDVGVGGSWASLVRWGRDDGRTPHPAAWGSVPGRHNSRAACLGRNKRPVPSVWVRFAGDGVRVIVLRGRWCSSRALPN